MPTVTIQAPSFHAGQRRILESDARFKVVAAGRRWGKSRMSAAVCAMNAAVRQRWWWIWPSYTNGAIGWRLLKRLGLQIPSASISVVDRSVSFPGGGFAQIKSADKPDSLRGEGLDGAIVDEAAHIRKFSELWEQALRPALSDRLGVAWFVSTPKGYNDFYELFQSNGDDWEAWQFPTSDNPFIAKSEIEAARKDLPELVFRQEYLAEFVQLEGALFRREWFEIVENAPRCKNVVRFWDLAASTKTSADYTVGAKVGMTDDGDVVILDVVRGRFEWPRAIRIISQTAKADGMQVRQGIEDVGTQKGMYQLLAREPSLAGLSFSPVRVTKDKITRASPWLARAEQGKVKLLRASWLNSWLDEVCAFPEVQHDDQVDAVSGAMQMLGSSVWVRGPAD